MYVVRRVYTTQPREARRVAELAAEMAKAYEEAGQRSDVRVYFNNGTVPGEKDRVYMEWVTDALKSPYRGDNEIPARAQEINAEVRKLVVDSSIEFYELFTPDKAMPQ